MKRPRIISFICIIGFLMVVVTFPQMFSPGVKKLGILAPALYGILVALLFMACIGLWHYKQWGAALLLISLFTKLIFYILASQIESGFYLHLILLVFVLPVFKAHYVKMNQNL